jgi:VIT1/CCC1 family predicted Fe2+/Mn2+ transporter
MVLWLPPSVLMPGVAGGSLLFLASLGLVAARAGGAPIGPAVLRVVFWGALAMALTAAVGTVFGVAG